MKFRSPLAALAVVAVFAGCVNVAAPSGGPSITPGGATPTGSTAPTSSPTALPTATAAPTFTSAPSPTSAPTPGPTDDPGFDQRDVDFLDDLSDPTGDCAQPAQVSPAYCWGVGTNDGGTVAYVEGTLRFDLTVTGAWMFSRRMADSTSATMRVIGDYSPTNDGRFGPVCAADDNLLFGGVVGTDGSWAFVKVDENGPKDIFGDPDAGLDVAAGGSNLVALECAGTATGKLRLTLWLGESGPVATWTQPNGPESFDRVGTYVDATSDDFGVALDNVVAFGSGIADGSYTPAGEALLAHVPEDWQSSCYPGLVPPYLARTAEAVVTCFLSSSNADGAEMAEYASFSSADAMQDAYQGRIDSFGSGDASNSCDSGPTETNWNFGEGTPDSGRLLCVAQFAGIRFDWTDTRLNILSSLVDFDADYARTYDDWLLAGPNE